MHPVRKSAWGRAKLVRCVHRLAGSSCGLPLASPGHLLAPVFQNEMALTMEAWRLTGRCGGGSRGALRALADCLSGFCQARLRASCFDILLPRDLFFFGWLPLP